MSPESSGALADLEVLDLSHLPRFKRAVDAGRQIGFGYYLPHLLSQNKRDRSVLLLGEDEGSICIYRWRRQGTRVQLDLATAPTPLVPQVLSRCLERANDYNEDRSARVLRIDAQDVAAASEVPQLRIRERKSQYLYAPKDFRDLAGRRYRTLRRNVVSVQQLAGLEVLPYSPEQEQACQTLLRRWRADLREDQETSGGVGTTRRLLALVGSLSEPDLHGEIIRFEDRIVAFAFAGELRPGVGCFVEAKSENGIQGLSYFQRYSFLSKLQGLDLVNDGSDAGRAGLRQLKQSLRPVAMHVEHRARQEGSDRR